MHRAPSVPPGSTPGAQYYMAPSAPYNASSTPAQYMQTSAVGSTAPYAHAPHHGYFGAPAAAHYPMSMAPYEHAPVASTLPLAPTMPLAPGPGFGYNYGDTSITHHSRVVDAVSVSRDEPKLPRPLTCCCPGANRYQLRHTPGRPGAPPHVRSGTAGQL